MASARRGRSGFEIFLNQRDFYVYTQLLPGAEMIYLKVWSGRTPLVSSTVSYGIPQETVLLTERNELTE